MALEIDHEVNGFQLKKTAPWCDSEFSDQSLQDVSNLEGKQNE